ncbi:ATP-binding protein [Streptomyces diacarni]|uniref:ATP-binding protein n=1 Tax=Streptomyces diacarni TaxID=2800381 RepID=UPI0033C494EF
MALVVEAEATRFRTELVVRWPVLVSTRRTVRAYVHLWGLGPLADDASLCTHELLANVPRHTGSRKCTLALVQYPGRLRVTVSDTSSELPVARNPDWVAETGRGLFLLNQLTDTWGVDVNPDGGKDVWFEMRKTPHREAA